MFAGRGALETTAQNLGDTITVLIEKDPVARTMLRRNSPGTLIIADLDDGDWRHWKRSKTAALGILAGPPRGPYAPSGKGKFLSDPPAQYLPGIGAVACALQPETINIEALYGIAGGDGTRTLANIDEVLNATDYIKIVPSNTTDVERTHPDHHARIGRGSQSRSFALRAQGPPTLRARATGAAGRRRGRGESEIASRFERGHAAGLFCRRHDRASTIATPHRRHRHPKSDHRRTRGRRRNMKRDLRRVSGDGRAPRRTLASPGTGRHEDRHLAGSYGAIQTRHRYGRRDEATCSKAQSVRTTHDDLVTDMVGATSRTKHARGNP